MDHYEQIKLAAFSDELQKIAALGFGVEVANKGRWGLNVGLPHGVAGTYRLSDEDGWAPHVGLGLTGPQVGISHRKAKEPEKTKTAMDPVTMGGTVALGKIGITNFLNRYGHKIAPIRWLGKEVAGVGVRTGMQGKPMLSRPFREVAAVGIDPKLTGLYENAHTIGRKLGPEGARRAQTLAKSTSSNPLLADLPAADTARKFMADVPLESRGVRRAVDYGFTPVSQVAKDIGSGARRAAQYGQTPVSQVARDIGGGVKNLAGRVFKRKQLPVVQ